MKNHLSEEILEILHESPRWLVRTGSTIMLALLLLVLGGTWFIHYPEVLKGEVVVTTTAPPIKVVSPGEGRLMRLLVRNGATVRKGEVLAEMESRTKLDNTPLLRVLLRQTQEFLQQPQRSICLPTDTLTWGDLQADVLLLCQNYLDIKNLQTDDFHVRQTANLKARIAALRQLQQVGQRKKDLNGEQFDNATRSYQTDKQLFTEGIYSRIEFMQKENAYLGKKGEQEEQAENQIRITLKLAEMENELQGLEYAYLEKQRLGLANIRQASHNIENSLRNWQQQYLLTAPSAGKLVYLQQVTENQFVKSGDTLFAVMSPEPDFVALVDMPVRGMGKASVGQKVVLKLDDYPFQEFGTIEGQVLSMAPSLQLKSYRLVVALPHGLQSSYHHTFICKSEMAGTAEVITADMRLFERAFYGLRKLVM